jgi:hypothetical protein
MSMLILNSHHLPDTHKRDVRFKILCVLNTPPRHNGVWGVKEYFLAVFIPTEKVKDSQLHVTAVYSQGKKFPLRVRWHPEPKWKQQKKEEKYLFSTENQIWILKPSVCCHYTSWAILVLLICIISRETFLSLS